MPRLTRRGLLKAAGTAGVTGLSAAAGCMGILGGGGGGSTATGTTSTSEGNGGTTTTANSTPELDSHLKWLPAPDQFLGGSGYTYSYDDVAGFAEHKSELHKETYNDVEQTAGKLSKTLGIAARDVGGIVQVGTRGTQVVLGDFDPAAMGETLKDQKFREREAYQNYDLYLRGAGDPTAVAVGSSAALVCRRSGENEPLAVARMLIDTSRGQLTPYVAANHDFAKAARPVVDGTRAAARLVDEWDDPDPTEGRFEGNTAFGYSFTVKGAETDLTFVLVFGEADEASADELRLWAENGLKEPLKPYEGYDVSASGRTATLTGTVPTEKLDFLSEGTPGEEELSGDD